MGFDLLPRRQYAVDSVAVVAAAAVVVAAAAVVADVFVAGLDSISVEPGMVDGSLEFGLALALTIGVMHYTEHEAVVVGFVVVEGKWEKACDGFAAAENGLVLVFSGQNYLWHVLEQKFVAGVSVCGLVAVLAFYG